MERAISSPLLTPLDPAKLAEIVETALDEDKAEEIVVIDLAGKSSFADCMVVASGRSARHVAALAERLTERLRAVGLRVKVEGLGACDWVLLDAGDVVVHLFRPEVRAFYNLEKMWGAPAPASFGALAQTDAEPADVQDSGPEGARAEWALRQING
ncbi:ribosome silencing factor [Rhodospirillum rubrum]|uniref:ribosome silencing factor n=1 Tax=Rhodospirillum rubrum TaxID=1085 RepID=UPI0028A92297|nr:ribosome silencing factor [Rhodospirillum rubrum]